MNQQLDIIHHTALQVKDISKAVSWYIEHFRCEVEYQDYSWAMLRFANTSLALVKYEQHPFHLAILSDDLSPYPDQVVHRDRTISAYINDVDGNYIEILKIPDDGNYQT